MEGETSGGYNHQRGKAVTGNDYNDKNTTAATTIMRSCSSCNLGVLCRMLTFLKGQPQKAMTAIAPSEQLLPFRLLADITTYLLRIVANYFLS